MSRPTRWFRELGGGAGLFPLFVLFGLTAVEQLDQRAFDVLLPNIRDTFGLDTQAILAVVGLTGAAALVIAVPIGYYADRLSRVRVATFGAVAWAVFSVLTGLAPALWVLGLARAGSGLGAATIVPTHNSLLSDYYDIPERQRLRSPSCGLRHRRVHRPTLRGPPRLLFRLAHTVHRLRAPDPRLRPAVPAPTRARAGSLRARRDGRERRGAGD